MRWLFIDTSQQGTVRVGVLSVRDTQIWKRKGRNVTLPFLASRIPLADLRRLDGVCVVSGPGPFSGLRSGILVANLIARWFRLPLVGIPAEDAVDTDRLYRDLCANVYSPTEYVAPVYGAEPNITIAKTS